MTDNLPEKQEGFDFNEFVLKHRSNVIKAVQKKTKNRLEAEDIAQDIFADFFTNTPDGGYDDPLCALFLITSRRAVDWVRYNVPKNRYMAYRRVLSTNCAGEPLLKAYSDNNTPQSLIECNEDDVNLRRAIWSLPKVQRLLIRMRYLSGLRVDQCVSLTGLSTGTVVKHLKDAVAKLRIRLKTTIKTTLVEQAVEKCGTFSDIIDTLPEEIRPQFDNLFVEGNCNSQALDTLRRVLLSA